MPSPLLLALTPNSIVVPQDGTQANVQVTVTRPAGDAGSVTLSVVSLPAGVTTQITSPLTGNSGSVAFAAGNSTAAGNYNVTIQASDSASTGTATVVLTAAVVATVQASTNSSAGIGGTLETFMSTSFQPAEWDFQFFSSNPGATNTLNNLNPLHIRLQPISQGTPEDGSQNWDFTKLDGVLNPVISVADHSPELQLAVAPAWMTDSSGHLLPSHFQDFANYSADLVRYYNTAGGFTDSHGVTHVHSPSTPVAWWGIFNEYNINGLTPADYVNLYNAVVPAMLAVDPTIKFSALELADFDFNQGDPRNNLPTFVSGVTAQVNIVSTHFYSSCNQKDTDAQIFSTISGFANDVNYFYSELRNGGNPNLANVPVWVTENNVNADFNAGNGVSACNPGTKFVLDHRGTSAFFAAWRPYVFSRLGKAGIQSLYHWDFDADPQYGEVDFGTGVPYLSYWVDMALQRYFPFCPPGSSCTNAGETILNLATTEPAGGQSVEVLATRNPDRSVVVMMANHAVLNAGDNNGPGAPRTVIVDLSALGPFTSATGLTLDASTNIAGGPAAISVTPAPRMTVSFSGYGVTFLKLVP